MPAIELRAATKRYDTGGEVVDALDGVDLAVDRGEFVSIIGPSGSGKSTLLNLLGLLDSPTTGEVWIDDRNVTDLTDEEATLLRREQVGFIFQDFYLLPTLTHPPSRTPNRCSTGPNPCCLELGWPTGCRICRLNSPAGKSSG